MSVSWKRQYAHLDRVHYLAVAPRGAAFIFFTG